MVAAKALHDKQDAMKTVSTLPLFPGHMPKTETYA